MKSAFKVLNAGTYFDAGEILAIVAGQEENGIIMTEWYYIAKNGKKPKGMGMKIRSSIFDSIEDFWKTETETSLINAIYFNEVFPLYERYKDYSLCKDVVLKEMDPHILFSIKANYKGFIHFLEKHTECQKLKDYLKMLGKYKIERQTINRQEF